MRKSTISKRVFQILITGILLLTPVTGFGAKNEKDFRVVLDPGHGGPDEGTFFMVGKTRLTEKDATLQLALKTAQKLRKKGYPVFLTRTQDVELALSARTRMANELKADIFISLHLNSSPTRPSAHGIETYILNNTTNETSQRLAYFENKGIGTTSREETKNSGLDVALILKDLRLDANLTESKRLACTLQENLARAYLKEFHTTSINRGVRQALFHVLLGSDMPSALVEAGFINHSGDRGWIFSPEGQDNLSQILAQAIVQFHLQKNTPTASSRLSRCKVF